MSPALRSRRVSRTGLCRPVRFPAFPFSLWYLVVGCCLYSFAVRAARTQLSPCNIHFKHPVRCRRFVRLSSAQDRRARLLVIAQQLAYYLRNIATSYNSINIGSYISVWQIVHTANIYRKPSNERRHIQSHTKHTRAAQVIQPDRNQEVKSRSGPRLQRKCFLDSPSAFHLNGYSECAFCP